MKYLILIALLTACGADEAEHTPSNAEKAEESIEAAASQNDWIEPRDNIVLQNYIDEGTYSLIAAYMIDANTKEQFTLGIVGEYSENWRWMSEERYRVRQNGSVDFYFEGEYVSWVSCNDRVTEFNLDADGWINNTDLMSGNCNYNLTLIQSSDSLITAFDSTESSGQLGGYVRTTSVGDYIYQYVYEKQ